MFDIYLAIAWFISCALIHIGVTKIRLILRIPRSWLLSIFVVGMTGFLITDRYLQHKILLTALPLTSALLYFSLSLVYMSLTASPTLGDYSPTTQLLNFLKEKPRTEEQIREYFRDNNVIQKRISDLKQSNCIVEKRGKIFVLPRGKRLAQAILLYRRILNLSAGG